MTLGYDMYWLETPLDVTQRIDAAYLEMMKATPENRDEAMRSYNKAAENYFRLNIWGMQACRKLLLDFDMAYYSEPEGAWPEPAGFGIEDIDGVREWIDSGKSEPKDPSWERYRAARERYLRSGVQERPGIALHKLMSNDGWVVTELECRGALVSWQRWLNAQGKDPGWVPSVDGELVEWWPEMLVFLATSAEHGGFVTW